MRNGQCYGRDTQRAGTGHNARNRRGIARDDGLAWGIECRDNHRFTREQRRHIGRRKRDASHGARGAAQARHDPVARFRDVDGRSLIQRAGPIERGELAQAVTYRDGCGEREAAQFAQRGERSLHNSRLHPSLRRQRALARE